MPMFVPLPVVDSGRLSEALAKDRELASSLQARPLSDDMRVLGTKLRAFHTLEAKEATSQELARARRDVDDAMAKVAGEGPLELNRLRAYQAMAFLEETHHFEKAGEVREELLALAGTFVRRMRYEGYCHNARGETTEEGHVLLLNDTERLLFFKQMWNTVLGLDAHPAHALTRDETRALYSFFLTHPHPPDSAREMFALAKRGAKDSAACAQTAMQERVAMEGWRLERVLRLGTLDPEYPLAFARGVLLFRRGQHAASAESFRDFLRASPQGPYALHAQNYLRTAVLAAKDE